MAVTQRPWTLSLGCGVVRSKAERSKDKLPKHIRTPSAFVGHGHVEKELKKRRPVRARFEQPSL